MKQFAAGDLTRNTGDLFEAAAVSPVAITKHRKPRFVVMSMERFDGYARRFGQTARQGYRGSLP
jgi:PHD/YefM family antitoxin component YafN of YafNO toxin-antitoxin module